VTGDIGGNIRHPDSKLTGCLKVNTFKERKAIQIRLISELSASVR
jgi:hypothetical protein